MFVLGVLLLLLALVGAAFAVVPPFEELRVGAIFFALSLGLGGALLVYLDAPSRRRKGPPGKLRAKATILDAVGTAGSVAGYQMVELTLEVQPRDGLPFQVKRKFSSGRLGCIEQGRRIDVVYDPANPQRVELA